MTDERTPLVTVLVTVRNARGTIGDTLDSFARLSWPADRLQFVIVDAVSTDGTWDLLTAFQESSPAEVVLEQQAGGISVGRNRGFELAKGDFVAVTDADMIVPPDWISQLMTGMDHPEVGVVGGPNDGGDGDWLERATNVIPIHGPSLGEVPVFGRSRYFCDFETTDDVFAAVTRNCLFRRRAFEEAGGFDERLITTEDGELNQRIMAAGYKIRYRKNAGVRHRHRNTVSSFFRQQRNYAHGQAQANRKNRAMSKPIHSMPAMAAGVLTLLLVAGFLDARIWGVAAAVVVLAGLACLAYGVKAAAVMRSPSLVLGAAFLFAVWQVAWAVGYPKGLFQHGGDLRHANS